MLDRCPQPELRQIGGRRAAGRADYRCSGAEPGAELLRLHRAVADGGPGAQALSQGRWRGSRWEMPYSPELWRLARGPSSTGRPLVGLPSDLCRRRTEGGPVLWPGRGI